MWTGRRYMAERLTVTEDGIFMVHVATVQDHNFKPKQKRPESQDRRVRELKAECSKIEGEAPRAFLSHGR